jgi:hypothetical protein
VALASACCVAAPASAITRVPLGHPTHCEQIWDDTAAAMPRRHAALQQLESALAAADAGRRTAMEAVLCALGAELEHAAHVDPGAAQRLLEGETLELDQALLEDRCWGLARNELVLPLALKTRPLAAAARCLARGTPSPGTTNNQPSLNNAC